MIVTVPKDWIFRPELKLLLKKLFPVRVTLGAAVPKLLFRVAPVFPFELAEILLSVIAPSDVIAKPILVLYLNSFVPLRVTGWGVLLELF